MALKLEQKFEEVARGIVKKVDETHSFFKKNSKRTRYVFKDYKGKRKVLELKGYVSEQYVNPAKNGDSIIVSQAPEGFTRIKVVDINTGELSRQRYSYFCPSSEAELH